MASRPEARGDDTSLFQRVSRIVNSELSLDEVLGQIVGLTSHVCRCDACLVYLVEWTTGELVLRASQLPQMRNLGNLRIKVGEGITGWVAQHQAPVALAARASEDPRFKIFPALVEDTYEAILSVPLITKGKTIGVVNVHHREEHRHSDEEITLIAFVGEQLGSAIGKSMLEAENARLAELELHSSFLEQEIAKRTAQLRAANEELRVARDHAEEVARLKSEFLANMSHEIRTPIHAIIGMTHLVLDSELKSEQREFLLTAKHAADSLLLLINDILDFARLESRKVVAERVEFPLADLIEQALKTLDWSAGEKGLELRRQLSPALPVAVVGDPGALRRVLLNLVGNSIKFTDQGKIVLEAKLVEQSESDLKIEFIVTDTGIGIPESKLASIFEAFVQVDGSSTRRHGGTGLGLAISSDLVTLMGGDIWVESAPGRGSSFHFTARCALPEALDILIVNGGRRDAAKPGLNKLEPALASMLQNAGHSVHLAAGAGAAVEVYAREPVDLIVIEDTAFDAITVIRNLEQSLKLHTPILAIAPRAVEGTDDFLAPPVLAGDLWAKMARVRADQLNLSSKQEAL